VPDGVRTIVAYGDFSGSGFRKGYAGVPTKVIWITGEGEEVYSKLNNHTLLGVSEGSRFQGRGYSCG
jgi:hypothetical protein